MSHAQDDYDHLRDDADATRAAIARELQLAEVWCELCPDAAARIVATATGDHYLCDDHARLLDFQVHSRNFNGGRPPEGRCVKCNAAIEPDRLMCDRCWTRRPRPGRRNEVPR